MSHPTLREGVIFLEMSFSTVQGIAHTHSEQLLHTLQGIAHTHIQSRSDLLSPIKDKRRK